MKKHIVFSGLLAASVFSLALVFSLAPAANAQTATTPVACPAGYTCTPIPTQPINCPAGFTCTPTNPVSPPSTAGTISIAQNGSAPTGGVVACTPSVTCTSFTLTAGPSSGMQVNSISVDFNTRPWLYFSTFSLVNQSTGSILSPATPLTASNFTEITVGSDYRYVISIPNLVISPNQSANVLLIANPLSGIVQNASNVISASVRAVDTNGVTVTSSTSGGSSGGGGGIISCYTWSNYLAIGSTGADVVALQTWLIANGYDIPAISQGRTTKGYFGVSTAAALRLYQASVGLPMTGALDTQTRVSINLRACTQPRPINPQPISSTGIVASLDPTSPVASTVQISTSAQTNNVPLAVFDVKSQGSPSTLQALNININTVGSSVQNLFSNIQIKASGLTYSARSISSTGPVRFNNMTIPLPANTYVPITVYATVAQDANNYLDGSNATVSLLTAEIQAVDSNYNLVPVTNNEGVAGSAITFSSTGVQVSNTSAVLGNPTVETNGTIDSYPVTFTFTMTAGNNPVYLSNAVTAPCPSGQTCISPVALVFGGTNGLVPIFSSVTAPVSSLFSGDGSNYFMITPGGSRSFVFSGIVTNPRSNNGVYTAQVVSINYGTNTSNLQSNGITSGLQNLQVTANFNGGSTQVPSLKASFRPASPLQSTYSVPQSNVTLAVIDLGAGQNPVTNLNNIQVGSDSTNASSLVSNIRVYMGSTLLGTAPSLTYNGSYYYQWIPVSNVNIPANLGVPLRIVADLDLSSVSSTSTVRVGIAGLNFSGSGANVTGLPVYGSSMYLIPAGGTTQQPTFTITYPIAGSVLQSGQTYNITWTGSDPGVNSYAVYLVGGSLGNTGSIFLGTAYPRGAGDTGTFSWTLIPTQYAPSGFTPGSGYQIQFSGKGVTGANSASFTITSPTPVSQPPVISGGTFPTTLTVGQTGTWSINASDPQNGSLSYNVNWGDAGNYVSAATAGFTQTSSFTHSYSSAGTYTVTFTVKNAAGLSAQTNTTVNVSAPTPVCPVGYICTPPNQSTTCPSGYTCTNTTSNCPPSYTCYTQSQNVKVVPTTPVVSINGSATPVTINSLPTDQGYSDMSSNHNDLGWPGYYLTLSWTSPGATSCSLTSGTGDIDETDPSPGSKTFSNVDPNHVYLEDGDTINFNCGNGSNSVTYRFASPTSMNTSATQPASAAQSSGWSSFLKFLGF